MYIIIIKFFNIFNIFNNLIMKCPPEFYFIKLFIEIKFTINYSFYISSDQNHGPIRGHPLSNDCFFLPSTFLNYYFILLNKSQLPMVRIGRWFNFFFF